VQNSMYKIRAATPFFGRLWSEIELKACRNTIAIMSLLIGQAFFWFDDLDEPRLGRQFGSAGMA
jgi:hypothetical protein